MGGGSPGDPATRPAAAGPWARLAPWAAGSAAATAGYLSGPGVGDFNVTHWLFTYELEFTRRALLGSLLAAFGEPDPELVRRVGLAVLGLASAALIGFAVWCLRGRPAPLRVGFAVLAVACPATLVQFGFDAGRFDQPNLVLLLGALVLVVRGSPAAPFAAALVGGVAALIHEAFLLLYFPVLLGLMIHAARGRVTRGIVCVGALVPIATALVIHHGPLEAVAHDDYSRQIVERHGLHEESVYYSTRVLYRQLPENVDYATRTLRERVLQWPSAAIAALLAPWLWAALTTLRSLYAGIAPGDRRGFWLPVIAAASPLLLSVAASDFFRLWALSVLDLFVVTLALLRMHPEVEVGPQRGWDRRWGWVVALLAGAALLAGPVGVDYPPLGYRISRVIGG